MLKVSLSLILRVEIILLNLFSLEHGMDSSVVVLYVTNKINNKHLKLKINTEISS